MFQLINSNPFLVLSNGEYWMRCDHLLRTCVTKSWVCWQSVRLNLRSGIFMAINSLFFSVEFITKKSDLGSYIFLFLNQIFYILYFHILFSVSLSFSPVLLASLFFETSIGFLALFFYISHLCHYLPFLDHLYYFYHCRYHL